MIDLICTDNQNEEIPGRESLHRSIARDNDDFDRIQPVSSQNSLKAENSQQVLFSEARNRFSREKISGTSLCRSSHNDDTKACSVWDSLRRRRCPLSVVKRQKKIKPVYFQQNAVLPRRTRRSIITHRPDHQHHTQYKVEGHLRDTWKEPFTIDQYNMKHSNDLVPRGSADDVLQNNREPCCSQDTLDGNRILQKLRILKSGGYWKHLPPEDGYRNVDTNMPGVAFLPRLHIGRKEENKENIRSTQNVNICDESNEDWSDDDGEDDEWNSGDGDSSYYNDPFRWSVFRTPGFYVQEVTSEGWICSRAQNKRNGSMYHDHGPVNANITPNEALLRLPCKVASLGRPGMYIEGIDLLMRRNNGVIEPCTRYESSGDGNHRLSRGTELNGKFFCEKCSQPFKYSG